MSASMCKYFVSFNSPLFSSSRKLITSIIHIPIAFPPMMFICLLSYSKISYASSPKIYGIAHISSDITSGNTTKKGFKVKSRSSRLGVKGNNTFKGNLMGLYRFEFQVDMTDDSNGDDFIKSRNMYTGLKDKHIGSLLIGRHDSAMKKNIGIKIFSDTVAEMTTIMGKDVGLYNRANNTIYFRSIRYRRLQLLASVSAMEGENTKNLFDIRSIAINYKTKNIYAGLANESADAGQKGNRITLGYSFISGHRIGVGYEFGQYSTGKSHKAFVINGIGILSDLYKLKATFGKRKAGETETAYGAAFIRDLGKKSELYMLYHNDINNITSINEETLSLGLKYVFY